MLKHVEVHVGNASLFIFLKFHCNFTLNYSVNMVVLAPAFSAALRLPPAQDGAAAMGLLIRLNSSLG